MKLLLDEMWSPEIARQMRLRGHDVTAVAEQAALAGHTDAVVFDAAQAEGRALVTENVADFRALGADTLRRGGSHAGLVFTTDRRFPRHDHRTAGRLVTALDRLLSEAPDLTNQEYWLS